MATKIDFRFLFDSNFFDEILKEDFGLIEKLAYITSKASGNKKRQNMISAKSRKAICENHNVNEETIRIFFNKAEEPEVIEKEDDEIARTLKHAINLTSEWPFRVILFTSKNKSEEYKKNKHYIGVTNVSIVHTEDAKEIIENWFKRCREDRLSSCD